MNAVVTRSGKVFDDTPSSMVELPQKILQQSKVVQNSSQYSNDQTPPTPLPYITPVPFP